MSKVSAFGFTNATDSSNTVTAKSLGLTSNYALATDTSDTATLNNKTAPIDLQEVISFKSGTIANLKSNAVNIQYPSKVTQGVSYSVQVTDTLSTTDTADATFRVDEPIIATISVRHPNSGNITSAHVATVLTRALSALIKADGSWRFDDLMRGAERPVVD
jgi:hypothetical protein